MLNIGNLNSPYKIQHFRWWQVNPWAHNNPVSLFRSWLEKKQLNSKGNSTQKTLQTWEGTALSLWTHWTVLTAESRATFVYAAPLTWSYQNTAGSQRNSALLCCPWSWSKQEKGPVRNAYFTNVGISGIGSFTFQTLEYAAQGSEGFIPGNIQKTWMWHLGIWFSGEYSLVGLTVGLDDNSSFFQLKWFKDCMIAVRSDHFGNEWYILYVFGSKLNVKIL